MPFTESLLCARLSGYKFTSANMSLACKTRYTRNAVLRYLSQRGWEVLWQLLLSHLSPHPHPPPSVLQVAGAFMVPRTERGPLQARSSWLSPNSALGELQNAPGSQTSSPYMEGTGVCQADSLESESGLLASAQGHASGVLPLRAGENVHDLGTHHCKPVLVWSKSTFFLLFISKAFPFHCPS